MRVADFHYDLPESRIAQHPLPQRRASRLLELDARSGVLTDRCFPELIRLVRPGDLLVLNDTLVQAARLHGNKPSGGRVEVLVERVLGERRCLAQVRASRALRLRGSVRFRNGYCALAVARHGDLFELELDGPGGFAELMFEQGSVPLPPYIRREPDGVDIERYQTVFANRPGAVAAPTAGLHFDRPLLVELERHGVETAYVTLHVGAGTFQPVRTDRVQAHRLHAERAVVSESVCAQVRAVRARAGRVVAVGTTSVRSLEAAARGGTLQAFTGDTDLFIYPGFRFQCIDAMITNFHLPRSTLLMLVCAFAGTRRVLDAYRHAIERRYRFYSYGDAMFVTRQLQ